MKYFSFHKTYEENRKEFLTLCKQHHPDRPTGNEAIMKQVNSEWESYEKFHKTHTVKPIQAPRYQFRQPSGLEIIFQMFKAMNSQPEYITFRGAKYIIDENILKTIALRYGGMGLLEFVHSKEWQDHIKKL